MYGKLNQRKLKQTDFILSCEEVRKELDEYIDAENRRVNVDSAKKLAVMQHMDYEGFRQMVLGANIFSTKTNVLYSFSKGEEANALAANKLFDEKKTSQAWEKPIESMAEGNSEKHCFNFRDFKKKFSKFYDKQLTRERAEESYSLLKQQNKSRLEKIFNLECEADIILKVLEVFNYVLNLIKHQEKTDLLKPEAGFMLKFLLTVLSIPTMQDVSLNILTKKQREKIAIFAQECRLNLEEESADEIDKLLKL